LPFVFIFIAPTSAVFLLAGRVFAYRLRPFKPRLNRYQLFISSLGFAIKSKAAAKVLKIGRSGIWPLAC
jgi:hypothetical protein